MLAPWHLIRLITHPWRMFSRLDSFTNEQCLEIFSKHANARLAAVFGSLLVGLATTVILAYPVLMLSIDTTSPWKTFETIPGRAVIAGACSVYLSIVLYLAAITYLAVLRGTFRRRVGHASCIACSYPLFGLPIADDRVTCPECGRVAILKEHGLRPDDLTISTAPPASALVRERAGPSAFELATTVAAALLPLSAIVWVLSGSDWCFLGVGLSGAYFLMIAYIGRAIEITRVLRKP